MTLNKDMVPSNLDQAISIIEEGLDQADKNAIIAHDACVFHHSVGRKLRNDWSLWTRTTPLCCWFQQHGIYHPDDMSGIIIESLKRKLSGQPIDLEGQVESYKKYWEDRGIDPSSLAK